MSSIPDNDGARENERQAHERFLGALSEVMSGGLTTNRSDGFALYPERALCRAAGCLLKGLMIGRYYSTPDGLSDDMKSWGPGSTELTDGEMVDGLSALVALLTNADTVMDGFEYRDDHERIEAVERREAYATKLAGEQEMARRDAEDEGGAA